MEDNLSCIVEKRLDREKLDEVVERVIRRLLRPRVGLLYAEEHSLGALPLPVSERFAWVPYTQDKLATLERPEGEGTTLSILAVPICSRALASELVQGFPVTLAGRLVFGCLGQGIPVLLDGSPFAAFEAWRGSRFGEDLLSRVERLFSWGVAFLPSRDESAEAKNGVAGRSRVLECRDPFVTWRELDGKLDGIASLRIGSETRLTQEASERLERLGINIIRRV